MRSSQNAFRHGLATPVLADSVLSAEAHGLARKIAGGDARLLEPALSVAEAQVDLWRIRRTRAAAISRAMGNPAHIGGAEFAKLNRLFVRAATAELRGRELFLSDPAAAWAFLAEISPDAPPSERELRVVLGLVQDLTALDRYERRTLSRRKFAVRALDAARSNAARP